MNTMRNKIRRSHLSRAILLVALLVAPSFPGCLCRTPAQTLPLVPMPAATNPSSVVP